MVIMSLGSDVCNACGPLPRGIEAGTSSFYVVDDARSPGIECHRVVRRRR